MRTTICMSMRDSLQPSKDQKTKIKGKSPAPKFTALRDQDGNIQKMKET